MGSERLDADIGLLEAVAVQVGVVIGAGLFSVTGVAIGDAGPGVALSYVVAIVAVSLSLIPTAVLGSLYPTIGGNYRYPSRLWSPRIAFLSAWGMAVSAFGGGLPLYGLTFGQYLDTFVSVDPLVVGVFLVTAFFLVNLVGIEPAARVQQLLLVVLAASLLVFVVGAGPAVETANFRPPFPKGTSGVLVGGALLYFVCMGANFIVDIGGEMRDAALTIPRSFLVSIPLILVAYVATTLVAIGTVGWRPLVDAPLSLAAEAALSPALAGFFTVGALVAIATTTNAVFMIAPKYLLALAEDGIFPSTLGDVNDRFGTPHWGLAFVFLFSVPFLLSPLSLGQHGTLMAFGSIVIVIPVMVSAIQLVRHRPEQYANAPFRVRPRLLVAISSLAIVLNLGLLALLAADEPRVFGLWLGCLGIGAVYYGLRSWSLPADRPSLPEQVEEL